MRTTPWALSALFIAPLCLAESVKPFRSGDSLGVILSELNLPKAELQKQLKSGFTTTFLFRLKLSNDRAGMVSRDYVFAVYYDLWDEVFRASLSSPLAGTKENLTFKSADGVLELLSQVKLFPIERVSALDAGAAYTAEITALLDPIQKDRAEMIRKWVSENSVNTGVDPTRSIQPQGQTSGTRTSNKFFGLLFDEYLAEGLSSAKWRVSVRSSGFKMSDLK
jgi:hypothetical protein